MLPRQKSRRFITSSLTMFEDMDVAVEVTDFTPSFFRSGENPMEEYNSSDYGCEPFTIGRPAAKIDVLKAVFDVLSVGTILIEPKRRLGDVGSPCKRQGGRSVEVVEHDRDAGR